MRTYRFKFYDALGTEEFWTVRASSGAAALFELKRASELPYHRLVSVDGDTLE